METFDFQGQPIAYVSSGNGEPIVFLHNGGTSHVIWTEVMASLAKNYRVFALDLLGYGASAKPQSGYTLETYVSLVADFVRSNRLSPVRLVGNCMGSAMSLAFAMRYPDEVESLVLINPLTEATFSAGGLGSTYWLRQNLPNASRVLYGGIGKIRLPQWIASPVLRFQLGTSGISRKVQQDADLAACYANPGQMRSLLAVVDDLASYGALDRFVPGENFPPICTIWGLQNHVLSPRAGSKLNQTLRPQREEWLEGCGHLPMMERPGEVSTIVAEFFSSCKSGQMGKKAGHDTREVLS